MGVENTSECGGGGGGCGGGMCPHPFIVQENESIHGGGGCMQGVLDKMS